MSDESTMTPGQLVAAAVRRDPERYLDQSITPFMTARRLMGGGAPRWFGKRAWFAELEERTDREVKKQELFATLVQRLVR